MPVTAATTVMSTAEAVSVAHAVGLRGWFLRGESGSAADVVECLAGTAANILALNTADHFLHLASAIALLGVGLGAERSARVATA